MTYGNQPYGQTPYGGGQAFFQVVGATSINPYTTILTFSEDLDPSSPEVRDSSNYSILRVLDSFEALPVLQVVLNTDLRSVRVFTPAQFYTLYRIQVSGITSNTGSELAVGENFADFTGYPEIGRLRAQVVRANGILIIFNQEMLANEFLDSPFSYSVVDPDGAIIPILEVTPNNSVNPTRVTLELGTPLLSGVSYFLTVSTSVRTVRGLEVLPTSSKVTWYNQKRSTRVALSRFTGEVQAPVKDPNRSVAEGLHLEESLAVQLVPYRIEPDQETTTFREGLTFTEGLVVTSNRFPEQILAVTVTEALSTTEIVKFSNTLDTRSTVELSLSDRLTIGESLDILPRLEATAAAVDPGLASLFGNPQGLVFFSPALNSSGAPLSSIQVDEVKACTEAHDTYRIPQAVSSKPLYTFGGSVTSTPEVTLLNSACLFTDFYRSGEARLNLSFRPQDLVPPPTDTTLGVILTEPLPPIRTSILNSAGWLTLVNPMPPIGDFIPEDNHLGVWAAFDASASSPYPFITLDNLSPLPGPVDQPTHHFVNPSETVTLVEAERPDRSMFVEVVETMGISEDFDLIPGVTSIQVNLSETLTLSDDTDLSIGIRLFESVAMSEGLSLTS